MLNQQILHKFAVLGGVLMILGGISLGFWALTHVPDKDTTASLPVNAARLPPVIPANNNTSNSTADSPSAASHESPLLVAAMPDSPLPMPAEIALTDNTGAVEAPPSEKRTLIAVAASVPSSLRASLDTANALTLVSTAIPSTGITSAELVTTGTIALELQSEISPSQTITTIGNIPTETKPAVQLNYSPAGGELFYQQYFAAATRFDTVDLLIRWNHLQSNWQGRDNRWQTIAILSQTSEALTQLLGNPGPHVQRFSTIDDVVEAAWHESNTLVIIPFDQLTPRLAVYAIDGQNPIENSAKFRPDRYPLVARLYAHPTLDHAELAESARAQLLSMPTSNRDPNRLTVVAMTGVTAMVRRTAAQMDRLGVTWPARVVGTELASADITAISNEVPFVDGCETDTNIDNLVFCSKPEYIEALFASGVDIIGLTGNHQNDYGLEHALKSLEFYAENQLPIYGGGINQSEAMAPLYLDHNGNRLAFLGANSYGPPFAWATEFSPGSAPFHLSLMSATIREIHQEDLADVVFAELQYQESYDTEPLFDQRLDFTALTRAGADIVTGVQSHVPQGIELLEDKLILYGLGNLYFDQMSSFETRAGLIVKHTIYDGRHISTQLLPTILYLYGQPRWANFEQRAEILHSVFAASYWQ